MRLTNYNKICYSIVGMLFVVSISISAEESLALIGVYSRSVNWQIIENARQVVEYRLKQNKNYEIIGFNEVLEKSYKDSYTRWTDSDFVDAYEKAFRCLSDYFLIAEIRNVNFYYEIKLKVFRCSDIQLIFNESQIVQKNNAAVYFNIINLIDKFNQRVTIQKYPLYLYHLLPLWAKINNNFDNFISKPVFRQQVFNNAAAVSIRELSTLVKGTTNKFLFGGISSRIREFSLTSNVLNRLLLAGSITQRNYVYLCDSDANSSSIIEIFINFQQQNDNKLIIYPALLAKMQEIFSILDNGVFLS